ncbi:MAG: hypothetical protein HOJ34_03830, partial [Kordiimonadaceae bacterium]|nr:hypothetical protein [Kordiimonadaceae bacterium]
MFIKSPSLKITLLCSAMLLTACDNASDTAQPSAEMEQAAAEATTNEAAAMESEEAMIARAMG